MKGGELMGPEANPGSSVSTGEAAEFPILHITGVEGDPSISESPLETCGCGGTMVFRKKTPFSIYAQKGEEVIVEKAPRFCCDNPECEFTMYPEGVARELLAQIKSARQEVAQ